MMSKLALVCFSALLTLSLAKSASFPDPSMTEEELNHQREAQLHTALQDIKDEIVMKVKQIQTEKSWVHEVHQITEAYQTKMQRVASNIKLLQTNVKDLLLKKKQIENLRLQHKLERKLSEASRDLQTMDQALHNVRAKDNKFKATRHEVMESIKSIKAELHKLQTKGSE